MKYLLSILCLVCLSLTGCVSSDQSGKVQNFLNTALPSEFTGDAHVEHFNPWFDITIDAGGLRKTNGRWEWDSLNYIRHDRFTHGGITLTPKPVKAPVPPVTSTP